MMDRKAIKDEARKIRCTGARINSILREEAREAKWSPDRKRDAEARAIEALKMEAESLMFRVNAMHRALRGE